MKSAHVRKAIQQGASVEQARTQPDVEVFDHGSVVVLNVLSKEAREWFAENVQVEQTWGVFGVVIERRFFEPLFEGLQEAGFTVV